MVLKRKQGEYHTIIFSIISAASRTTEVSAGTYLNGGRTTDLSVCSVAYSSGFSDEIHFMKAFKKAVGVSALQYWRSQVKE